LAPLEGEGKLAAATTYSGHFVQMACFSILCKTNTGGSNGLLNLTPDPFLVTTGRFARRQDVAGDKSFAVHSDETRQRDVTGNPGFVIKGGIYGTVAMFPVAAA
jgi:hypothetical protein